MPRRLPTIVTLTLVFFLTSIGLVLGQQLTIEPACSGHGIGGNLRGHSAQIQFTACTLGEEQLVSIFSAFEPLVSLRLRADRSVEIALAGHDPSAPLDADAIARIDRMIGSQAAALARQLIPALERAGLAREQPEVRLLAVALMGLAQSDSPRPAATGEPSECEECAISPDMCDCSSLRCDCYGCCGLGCSGCTGICSRKCWEHDRCVRTKGHLECLGTLGPAIVSTFVCDRTQCAPEDCYDCWR